jgi:hypothetical protein
VDNVVDKALTAAREPRNHAVLDKLLIPQAKLITNKINGLQTPAFCPTTSDEAYSYKFLQQGISSRFSDQR